MVQALKKIAKITPVKREADPKMIKSILDDAESLRDPRLSIEKKVESLDTLIDDVLDLYQTITPEKQPWMFPSMFKFVHGYEKDDGTWSRGYWAKVSEDDE
jgi:hypothetical protein